MGEQIAFIGVGRMGSGMVGRLLAAGHSVTIFDPNTAALTPLLQAGARAAESAAAAAAAGRIVMTSLPGPDTVKATAATVAQISDVEVFVDLSTIGPGAAQAIAKILGPKGIAAIDAPVSGGVKGAATGKLAIMASGPKAALQRVEPLLAQLGKVYVVGEKPGLGQTLKLANNLMSAA